MGKARYAVYALNHETDPGPRGHGQTYANEVFLVALMTRRRVEHRRGRLTAVESDTAGDAVILC